jgi:formate dehydrogenase major subunit
VGPAFNNTHIEAECEFCGACVSVCPTGALSEKNRKWAGVPSSYKESICPFCGMHCEIQIATKKGKIIGTFPPGEPHDSGGELCVKGRFCLSEMVNHPDRVLEPQYRFPEGYGIVSYEDAVKKAAEHLQAAKGKRTAFYLSPNLSLEELAAVKLFAGEVMGTGNITSSVLSENQISYLALSEKSIPLEEIEKAGAIVTLFLKGDYAYGPVTLSIKRAAEKGVPLYQVGWTRDTTSRFADHNIVPGPGKEKNFFKRILQAVEKGTGGGKDIQELLKVLTSASPVILVLGPWIAELSEGKEILETIEKIANQTGVRIFAPCPYGNLFGLLSVIEIRSCEEIDQLVAKKGIDMLYIIGDTPFDKRPPVDFIIHQGAFPPPEELQADLILPAATYGEIAGTIADSSGKTKKFKEVVKPPGKVPGNREVLADIASAVGKKEVKFIQKEISDRIPKNLSLKLPPTAGKSREKGKVNSPDPRFPYLLIREKTPHAFHNVSLSKIIAGMAEILPEETLLLHPEDAGKLGLSDGDTVVVESADSEKEYPLKLRETITPGFVCLLSFSRDPVFKTNPCPVHLRRKNV